MSVCRPTYRKDPDITGTGVVLARLGQKRTSSAPFQGAERVEVGILGEGWA